MASVLLQRMAEAIPDERLPGSWAELDLRSFSPEKRLWDYQQKALKNALKALWKYYKDDEGLVDDPGSLARKRRMWEWYRDHGLREDLSVSLSGLSRRVADLLREYYEPEDGRIGGHHFINRMSFWMATGSGKTLVIVKLIELLARLIGQWEIPPGDILFLTHREDLLGQLRRHVEEFNRGRNDLRIVLRELREYPSVQREGPTLFRGQEIVVFYYRSDNLSDEQKEKIVDFRNYENGGRWYVLLDEAHKGDREESIRRHIYAILSRNGFLFNFSATFTAPLDIVTCVFNFNLERYIQKGYGKHVAVLQQEMRAFREGEDYGVEEKQQIVLKALMLLAYGQKAHEALRRKGSEGYHRPLMLVLAHSVNLEDADLELFFRELERIARGDVPPKMWERAREELWQELRNGVPLVFEGEERAEVDEAAWKGLTYPELLRTVFNAPASGEVEVLVRPSNRQEMAFKLKNAERPFALLRIGDISRWLKEKLEGYEVNERFEDEGYFARLNADDSDITILMGSRAFYEGWDSNRPNVICYINIGVGEEARKFVLQSIGRGVRIEPLKNHRKRLLFLYNEGRVKKKVFDRLKRWAGPLETLFVFGTNREAIQGVLEAVQREGTGARERRLPGFEVNPEVKGRSLLIPVYRSVDVPLAEARPIARLEVEQGEWEALKALAETTDPRVLLLLGGTVPQRLRVLRQSLEEANRERFYKFNGRRSGDLLRLLRRALDYFGIYPEEVDRLKELADEIRHFRHIVTTLEDITELQRKVEVIKSYPEQDRELKSQYGKLPPEEYTARAQSLRRVEEFEHGGHRIRIQHIARHYYLPVVLSEDERIDYIRHIIKTKSEVEFIKELEKYLGQKDNRFEGFDWWFFSKLDESLDEVYLPYYDPRANRIARFKPDFIFWLKKGCRYFIVFVDPKGMEHVEWQRKVDGYRALFQADGKPRVFPYNTWKVTVHLFLYGQDAHSAPDPYREFWIRAPEEVPVRLV